MARKTLPVASAVLDDRRHAFVLWGLAVAAVTALYVSFYPAMGEGADIEAFVANMPDALVQALGYDQIATPAGYLRSTVYGLLAPALLLVFAIGGGARLIAGQEEDGTLELDLTAPVARRELLAGRLLALWMDVALLVAVVTVTTLGLAAILGMQVGPLGILAAGTGLLLLVLGFGTLALAVGAATGRRAPALAVAAGLAVLAFIFAAIAPTVGADWMAAVSPFSWYLGHDPLTDGFHLPSLILLAAVPLLAAGVALATFDRRDLMV